MNKISLLLIEDDDAFRTVTKQCLELTGEYVVCEAKNGLEGYESFESQKFDIIVTDVDMPMINGFALIELIRKKDTVIPILVTSGLTSSLNVHEGSKRDIDNYIKKPFQPEELDYYIKFTLNRIKKTTQLAKEEKKATSIGSYTFDVESRCLTRAKVVVLTRLEADILHLLLINKGEIVYREDILKKYWGSKNDPYHSRSLNVFINKLRNYLKDDPAITITTIRGEGLVLTC